MKNRFVGEKKRNLTKRPLAKLLSAKKIKLNESNAVNYLTLTKINTGTKHRKLALGIRIGN